jgi:hypothetical protein
VNTGAFDSLEEIGPLVRELGGWLHVDGAFGLWAAESPSFAPLVQGSGLADSWTTDGHKWLNVPTIRGLSSSTIPSPIGRRWSRGEGDVDSSVEAILRAYRSMR